MKIYTPEQINKKVRCEKMKETLAEMTLELSLVIILVGAIIYCYGK
jgi:hypothetical protein